MIGWDPVFLKEGGAYFLWAGPRCGDLIAFNWRNKNGVAERTELETRRRQPPLAISSDVALVAPPHLWICGMIGLSLSLLDGISSMWRHVGLTCILLRV